MISKTTLKQASKVSIAVGTILLFINQYEAIFAGAELKILPAILTYCVPFVVFIIGQRSR